MSTINDGGPAFPFGQISEITGQPINGYFAPGMTLRQYYAGQVLIGMMANPNSTAVTSDTIAAWCFQMADAMLKAEQEVKP
jgi:hypothetical protein